MLSAAKTRKGSVQSKKMTSRFLKYVHDSIAKLCTLMTDFFANSLFNKLASQAAFTSAASSSVLGKR